MFNARLLFSVFLFLTAVLATDIRVSYSTRIRNALGDTPNQISGGRVDQATAQKIVKNMGKWSKNKYQARMSSAATNMLTISYPTVLTSKDESTRIVNDMKSIVTRRSKDKDGCCVVMR